MTTWSAAIGRGASGRWARWARAGLAVVLAIGLPLAPVWARQPARDAASQELPRRELVVPEGYFESAHASSLVELANGDLFVVWYAKFPGGDAAIWGARRPAAADGWTAPAIVHDTPGWEDKNPVLYRDGERTLRLFWAVEEPRRWWRDQDVLWTKMSADAGETWGAGSEAGFPAGVLPRTHLLRLTNGWILLPLYVEWSASAVVSISKDGGATWERPRPILPFLGIQPSIIQRSDGTLYALMRSGAWPRRAWRAVSRSFGERWGGHRLSAVKNPGSALEMLTLRNGEVALAFNDSTTDRVNLTLALSEDEGATWTHVRRVEHEPGRAFGYPSLAQDQDGLIHVVYSYHDRRAIAHFVTDAAWIRGERDTPEASH